MSARTSTALVKYNALTAFFARVREFEKVHLPNIFIGLLSISLAISVFFNVMQERIHNDDVATMQVYEFKMQNLKAENYALQLENVKLNGEVGNLKVRLENALIPEASVSEFMNNRVVPPIKSAYNTVADKTSTAYVYVKEKATNAYNYLSQ